MSKQTQTLVVNKVYFFFERRNAHTAIERLPLRAHKTKKESSISRGTAFSAKPDRKMLKSFLNCSYGYVEGESFFSLTLKTVPLSSEHMFR